jgi:myo-inositol-1(or 4)-monophosphatase
LTKRDCNIDILKSFAMDTVRKAGDDALTYFGKGKSHERYDADLVTKAELHLTQFFEKELFSHFPDHLIFQNTQERLEYSHDENRYLWIFDPMDGSANFQAGIPLWGISLALVENFWPIFGIYYFPALGDIFHASAGGPAFHGDETISIAAKKAVIDESVLFTFARFHKHYICHFPGKIRDFGCTGAHICYVAKGLADAAVISNEAFQNLASLRCIIESAGGKICNMDGSHFFLNEYLNGHQINNHLLVGAPDICDQIPKFLKPID